MIRFEGMRGNIKNKPPRRPIVGCRECDGRQKLNDVPLQQSEEVGSSGQACSAVHWLKKGFEIFAVRLAWTIMSSLLIALARFDCSHCIVLGWTVHTGSRGRCRVVRTVKGCWAIQAGWIRPGRGASWPQVWGIQEWELVWIRSPNQKMEFERLKNCRLERQAQHAALIFSNPCSCFSENPVLSKSLFFRRPCSSEDPVPSEDPVLPKALFSRKPCSPESPVLPKALFSRRHLHDHHHGSLSI